MLSPLLLALLACGPSETPPVDTAQINTCDLAPTGQIDLSVDESMHSEDVEWWYWTGHLQDEAGRWYGFEETFFLFDISGVLQATSAHIAVVDVNADAFSYDITYDQQLPESMSNGFSLSSGANSVQGQNGEDHLVGQTDGYAFDLNLNALKPAVFQHQDGYTDYPDGGYTYYYSRERMAISGTLNVNGEDRVVSGTAWMDHQWGSLVSVSITGWDWFALQLDDNREIMIFHLKGSDVIIGASITEPGCETRELSPDEFSFTSLSEWTSPHSGCTYPMNWDITIGDETFHLETVREDQELHNQQKTYWEGAYVISGSATGRAYVELAGDCG